MRPDSSCPKWNPGAGRGVAFASWNIAALPTWCCAGWLWAWASSDVSNVAFDGDGSNAGDVFDRTVFHGLVGVCLPPCGVCLPDGGAGNKKN